MTSQNFNASGSTNKATAPPAPKRGQDVKLGSESVAGEEDPGAALDTPFQVTASASGAPSAASGAKPLNPGDEAPAGTPGSGEGICRECGGSGQLEGGAKCASCNGSGKVTVGMGGG